MKILKQIQIIHFLKLYLMIILIQLFLLKMNLCFFRYHIEYNNYFRLKLRLL